MFTITFNGLMVMQHQTLWMLCVNVKLHELKFQKFQKNLPPILDYFSAFDLYKRVILLKKSFSSSQFSTEREKRMKLKLSRAKPFATKDCKILGINLHNWLKPTHFVRRILSRIENFNFHEFVNMRAKSLKNICQGVLFSGTAALWTATMLQLIQFFVKDFD